MAIPILSNVNSLTSNGNITIPVDGTNSKSLLVASGSDYGTANIGRMVLGKMGWDDHAGWKHHDAASQTQYAMLQNPSFDTFINAGSGRTIYFRTNNSNAMYMTASNATFVGTVTFSDHTIYGNSVKARFGADDELDIYHNGSHSYIQNDTGNLYIQNSAENGDVKFRCDEGGAGSATNYITLDGSEMEILMHQATIFEGNVKLGTEPDSATTADSKMHIVSNTAPSTVNGFSHLKLDYTAGHAPSTAGAQITFNQGYHSGNVDYTQPVGSIRGWKTGPSDAYGGGLQLLYQPDSAALGLLVGMTLDGGGNATFAGDIISSGSSKSIKTFRRWYMDGNADFGINNADAVAVPESADSVTVL